MHSQVDWNWKQLGAFGSGLVVMIGEGVLKCGKLADMRAHDLQRTWKVPGTGRWQPCLNATASEKLRDTSAFAIIVQFSEREPTDVNRFPPYWREILSTI
jgi:hypothetical protein